MKKNLAKNITLSILAGAVLMSSSVVWAGVTVNVAPTSSSGNGWFHLDVPNLDVPGSVSTPSASDNTVNISTNDTVNYQFAGGYADGSDASKNIVNISNGIFNNNIYGGYSKNGNAIENTVKITGGTVNQTIYGGFVSTGDANNNAVIISSANGTIRDAVYGGRVDNGTNGSANNNTVSIDSDNITIANVYGGFANTGSAIGNTVNIGKGTISSGVYGGYVETSGNANNNTVNISGGTFNNRFMMICGGNASNGSGSANNNIVNISGGTFTNSYIYGGNAAGKTASDNTINISGGTFTDSYIYGGNGLTVDDNTINIVGAEANLETANIYGYDGGGTSHQSNLLNIDGWSGSVKTVQKFNNINFENVEWDSETSDAVMKVTSTLGFESDTTVTVGDLKNDNGDKPEVNDQMTLISASSSSGTGVANADKEQKFKIGSFVRAEGVVKQDANKQNIILTITDVSANEEILALGESRVAATAFTNQGSELIETGLDALARDNDKDTKVFAALYGNASEYETGSHVKVNGWNGIVGVGKTNANGVTMGAFFENGEGNYRTFNEYEGDLMRGDGEATYNGGGFLYRKDNASGVYTEASLRAGNLQNELRNVVIAGDELVGYDIDTFYYGAHVGVGKVIPRGNEGDSIDVYGKFIYAHYDDEDFTIDGGKFHLDSIESERLRLGFRINEVQDAKLTMYYGAAWEYEFGGDSNNAVVGYDIDINSPSLEGSTVIGEVGMHYKASDKWSIDLNGRAYVGQREGFSGSVQANYAF